MPDILPFRGLYYNSEKAELGKVLSPPYDVISAAEQDELYARHERNIIRLEYSREPEKYALAARLLQEWQAEGTIIHDDKPSLYLVSQTFKDRSGKQVQRGGVIALCKLEGFGSGTILPHERTFPKPKEDRLKLLTHTRAMFSPIFAIYSDPSRVLEDVSTSLKKDSPLLTGKLDDVAYRVWKVNNIEGIERVQALLRQTQVFIADGHHRYETALEYQKERRRGRPAPSAEEGYDYTLMYFSSVEEGGLVIFPIHRVIHRIDGFKAREFLSELALQFNIEQVDSSNQLMMKLRERGRFSFGIAMRGEIRYALASLRDTGEINRLIPQHYPHELKELDVILLHAYIIPRVLKIEAPAGEPHVRIEFTKDESQAFAAVEKGDAQIAFLLTPTRVEQVQAVAGAGITMPQKSTYFYPKLPAGLVMFDLENF